MLLIKKFIILILLSSSIFFTESKAEDKFLSLKNNIVNVRHQPTGNSQIKYIYKKINLPVKQIDKKENYSRIIDLKNNSGWIHSSQLKPSNSIIILEDKILFKGPSNFSKPIVRLEEGRLLVVNKCKKNWCSIKTDTYSGWVKTNNIWGSIK
ncbi:SH3 domain-containing protein [Candidatus Pelagibacter sp.]|jgi:SH3-like domain-containing protein|nr:SH3 domain-containing protein [Candidatus Pelagibacter sp.]|tara:strand:- start:20 stop:475 length:456 start_codon:yes stop_codon:yes gene_type:complete